MKVEVMELCRVRKSVSNMNCGEVGIIVDENANPRILNTIIISCPDSYIYNFNLGMVDNEDEYDDLIVEILPKGMKIQIIVGE